VTLNLYTFIMRMSCHTSSRKVGRDGRLFDRQIQPGGVGVFKWQRAGECGEVRGKEMGISRKGMEKGGN